MPTTATRPVRVPPNAERWRFPYEPFPPQKQAHQVLADETFYGGAAGGGKSDWIIASHVLFALAVPGSSSAIFRRTFADLERSIIPRMLDRLPSSVATYNATKHTWTFRNGSRIELGHLQRQDDVLKYQGAEYQLVSFDELTQFTEHQWMYLISRLRAAGKVAARLAELGLRPRAQAAGNPGGPGHHWVKARFIDPAPPRRVWRPTADLENPRPGTRVFMPSKASDNPHIDASYQDRLASLDPLLRRALLEGDWDILEGVRFSGWRRNVHVIEPEMFPIPLGGGVHRAWGVDYGLDAPFAAYMGAKFGDGLVVVYKEIYEVGLTPRQQAEAIRDHEAEDERGPGRQIPIALDPACWIRDPTQPMPSQLLDKDEPPPGSIASYYRDVFGRSVVKARNNRLAGAALLDDKMRKRKDGLPRILIYSTCTNLIRTLPALPRSPRNIEDVDTNAEDHAYDGLRYLLMELEGGPARRKTETTTKGGDVSATTGGLRDSGF